MAGSGSHPSFCSCARQSSGITADACRPGGYLAMVSFAYARLAGVNTKVAGWFGCSRRTAIGHSDSAREVYYRGPLLPGRRLSHSSAPASRGLPADSGDGMGFLLRPTESPDKATARRSSHISLLVKSL